MQIAIIVINQQFGTMFFCKDVQVFNYECHYHCTPQPNTSILANKLNKKGRALSKVAALPTRQPLKQSNKSEQTLLQRVRRKTQSLQSTGCLEQKNKNRQRLTADEENPKQFSLQQLQFSLSKTSSERTSLHSPNFSFSLPKQILISHTFNQPCYQTDRQFIEEESELVQPSLANKFIKIQLLLTDKQFEQNLVIDIETRALFTMKQLMHRNNEKLIHNELKVYNKIGVHSNILSMYQICFHEGCLTIIKEPSQTIDQYNREMLYTDIKNGLEYLKQKGIFMPKLVLSDIRQCFDVYKIANLTNCCEKQQISIDDNIKQLVEQMN